MTDANRDLHVYLRSIAQGERTSLSVLAGLVTLPWLRRSPALLRPTALVVLLVSGLLTFLATALLFPVATLWGTFLHASGPLLVGLIVAYHGRSDRSSYLSMALGLLLERTLLRTTP